MIRSWSFASALLLCLLAVLGQCASLHKHDGSFQPDHVLVVTQELTSIACKVRSTLLVNGTTPGPEIRMKENQTSWIRVHNNVQDQNLTIHWHGLSEATSPFSDGTPRASQWPIPPNHFFDYEVHPSIGEAGSYYYHSHVAFEAVSVAGPLIVEEASGRPPYEYEGDKVFMLTELYNRTDAQVVQGLTNPTAQFSWSGETEAVLVNGKSPFSEDGEQSQTTPVSNASSVPPKPCEMEVFHVKPSTTYRFRFIGAVALSLVTLAFEGHKNLTVIAADGSYTLPHSTDHIQIDSGQRFDILLHTKSADELREANQTSFLIQLQTVWRPTVVLSYAQLAYAQPDQTIPSKPPLTLSENDSSWLEYALEPLEPNDFPTADEVTRRVYMYSDQIASEYVYWSVSNHTWVESSPPPPYLVDIYKYGEAAIPNFETALANGGRDPALNAYAAEVGEVLEIILENEPNGQAGGYDIHPWHIHGRHVYDIGSGPGPYNATANEERLKGYNPVRRDTTMLYKYTPGSDDDLGAPPYSVTGWRGWRLRVQDTGVWMVHCHTLQHMIMGMQTVWVMGNASQITAKTEPFVSGYLDYGGSAYGNASYDPFVMHYFD